MDASPDPYMYFGYVFSISMASGGCNPTHSYPPGGEAQPETDDTQRSMPELEPISSGSSHDQMEKGATESTEKNKGGGGSP